MLPDSNEDTYFRKRIRDDHEKSHEDVYDFPCTMCDKKFKNSTNLRRHCLEVHERKRLICEYCNKSYPKSVKLKDHIESVHGVWMTYRRTVVPACIIGAIFYFTGPTTVHLWYLRKDTHHTGRSGCAQSLSCQARTAGMWHLSGCVSFGRWNESSSMHHIPVSFNTRFLLFLFWNLLPSPPIGTTTFAVNETFAKPTRTISTCSRSTGSKRMSGWSPYPGSWQEQFERNG